MTREEFFAINDQKFLSHGFKKVDPNPFIYYELPLVSDELIEEQDLDENDVPALLYGNIEMSGHLGYAIYTGAHFLWISCDNIDEAVAMARKITNFQEC